MSVHRGPKLFPSEGLLRGCNSAHWDGPQTGVRQIIDVRCMMKQFELEQWNLARGEVKDIDMELIALHIAIMLGL